MRSRGRTSIHILVLVISVASLMAGCKRETKETKEDFQAKVAKYTAMLAKNPSDTIALYNRGWYNLKLGNYEIVVDDCDKLIALSPKLADAYYMRGYSRDHEQTKSTSSSFMTLADFRTTTQLDPNHRKAWAALGQTYSDNGVYDSAIIFYSRAVRLDSSLALGYYGRGLTYMRLGLLDSAMADCERSLVLDPDYGKSFDLRGCIKYRLGDYVGSARDIYRCIAMDGDSASAVSYCNLGAAEHFLGLLDIEMDAYQKSIAIDSTYPDPYYNLARVLDRDRDDTNSAVPFYEKYLIYAKDKDSTDIAFVRARLDSISRGLEAK